MKHHSPEELVPLEFTPEPREDDEEPYAVRAMRQRAVLAELGLYLPLEVTK